MLCHIRLFATPRTVACQASLSVGFSRQEYWSVLRFPSPGDLPYSGIKPGSPALQADSLPSEPPGMLSVIVVHRLSCSAARGIFPDQELNLCPLHWQMASHPLYHQGSPVLLFSRRIPSALFHPMRARPADLRLGCATCTDTWNLGKLTVCPF